MEWQILVGVGGFFISVGGIIYGIGRLVGWVNGKFESQDKSIADFKESEEEKRKQWEEIMESQMLPACRKEFQDLQHGITDLSVIVGEVRGKVSTILTFVSNGQVQDKPTDQKKG